MDMPLREKLYDHYHKSNQNGLLGRMDTVRNVDEFVERMLSGDHIFVQQISGSRVIDALTRTFNYALGREGSYDLIKVKPWTADLKHNRVNFDAVTFEGANSGTNYETGPDKKFLGEKKLRSYQIGPGDLYRVRVEARF